MWAATQVPLLAIPFTFLGTWVHELGHGLGALMTGGSFLKMIVSPDFSGTAHTAVSGQGARVVVILSGLLAPAFVGGGLLVLSRGFRQSRLALGLLTFGLILTGVLWAGDGFTRITVLAAGLIIGLLAFRAPPHIRQIAAQMIAISICLNAVTHIDYFFMRGGVSGGRAMTSDTGALAQIIGLPHLFWAMMLTVFSMGILYVSVRMSGKLSAVKRDKTLERKTKSKPIKLKALK